MANNHVEGVDSIEGCHQAAVEAGVDAFSYRTVPDVKCVISLPEDQCKRRMVRTKNNEKDWAIYYVDCTDNSAPATRNTGNYQCQCGPMDECCGWNGFECCPAGYCSAGSCYSSRSAISAGSDPVEEPANEECSYTQQCESCKCGGAHADDHIEGVDSLEACYQAALAGGLNTFSYRSKPDIKCSIAFPQDKCRRQMVRTKNTEKDWAIYYIDCKTNDDQAATRNTGNYQCLCGPMDECCGWNNFECCPAGYCSAGSCYSSRSSFPLLSDTPAQEPAYESNAVTRNTGNYQCLCGPMDECCGWNMFECCPAGYCSAGGCHSSRSAIPVSADRTVDKPTKGTIGGCTYTQQCESCKCGGADANIFVDGVDSIEACHQAAVEAGAQAFSYRTKPNIKCAISIPDECKRNKIKTRSTDKDWAIYYVDCTTNSEPATRNTGNYQCQCGPMDECCGWNGFECCPAGYCSAGSCYSSRSAIPAAGENPVKEPANEECSYTQQCESCKCGGAHADDHIEGVDSLEACYQAALAGGLNTFSYRSKPDIKCSIAFPQSECRRQMVRTTNTEKDWGIYYIDCKTNDDEAINPVTRNTGNYQCLCGPMDECCGWNMFECCPAGYCSAGSCYSSRSSFPLNDIPAEEGKPVCKNTKQCESCKCGGAHSNDHIDGVDSLEACQQAAVDAGVDAFSYRTTPDIRCSIGYKQDQCEQVTVKNKNKDWAVYYVDCQTNDDQVRFTGMGNECGAAGCGPGEECCGGQFGECCPAGLCGVTGCMAIQSRSMSNDCGPTGCGPAEECCSAGAFGECCGVGLCGPVGCMAVKSRSMSNECGPTGCGPAEECCSAGAFGECCGVGLCGSSGCMAEKSDLTRSVEKPGILVLIILASLFGVMILGYFVYNQCLKSKFTMDEEPDSTLLGDRSYTSL